MWLPALFQGSLEQQSPLFLAPEINFMEDTASMNREWEDDFGMIQKHQHGLGCDCECFGPVTPPMEEQLVIWML